MIAKYSKLHQGLHNHVPDMKRQLVRGFQWQDSAVQIAFAHVVVGLIYLWGAEVGSRPNWCLCGAYNATCSGPL